MAIRHRLRRSIQRLGFDIVRHPPHPMHDASARLVALLKFHNVNRVIDVGANSGQFGSSIRQLGYTGKIVSFEPLSQPFELLNRRSSADHDWDVYNLAIGDVDGSITINVAGNAGLSSSALPMLQTHQAAAPDSQYVGKETVAQSRLDKHSATKVSSNAERTFLKIDVQGYEHRVLDGASGLLSSASVIGMQLELSLIPLYEGGMTFEEGLKRADGLTMSLVGLDPGFTDPATGRLLQVDGVFFKDK